jgi:hypothetical protein
MSLVLPDIVLPGHQRHIPAAGYSVLGCHACSLCRCVCMLPPLMLLLQAAISTICEVQDAMGVRDISLLNFVVSDGSTLIATRFVRPDSESAATLYYAEGASFDRQEQQQQQTSQQHTCSPAAGCGAAAANGTAGDSGSADDEALTPPAGTGAAGGLAGEDGCTVCGANNLVGSSVLCEASYNISYRERGAHVAFVASEPITGSTTDWVRWLLARSRFLDVLLVGGRHRMQVG